MGPYPHGSAHWYEIRVGGHLGGTLRSAFPDMRTQTRDGDTVLSGVLADQAALFGVLAQIEALGLELITVHRPPAASGLDAGRRGELSIIETSQSAASEPGMTAGAGNGGEDQSTASR
jgi:hypothetical protein